MLAKFLYHLFIQLWECGLSIHIFLLLKVGNVMLQMLLVLAVLCTDDTLINNKCIIANKCYQPGQNRVHMACYYSSQDCTHDVFQMLLVQPKLRAHDVFQMLLATPVLCLDDMFQILLARSLLCTDDTFRMSSAMSLCAYGMFQILLASSQMCTDVLLQIIPIGPLQCTDNVF